LAPSLADDERFLQWMAKSLISLREARSGLKMGLVAR
jgi:hypothetical protein